MKFAEYKYLILSDLHRLNGKINRGAFLRYLLLGRESYRYNFWLRTCRYSRSHAWLKYLLYPLARLILHRLTYRMGISIPVLTEIGSGFYIGHFGGIVVSGKSVIGRNCNISQGVTLGKSNRGRNVGYPILGDGVYIGPGAKIVGAVRIGHNVAIGANCVVTCDIPDNSVVVGIPGRVISQEGAAGYVNFTDYEDKLGGPTRPSAVLPDPNRVEFRGGRPGASRAVVDPTVDAGEPTLAEQPGLFGGYEGRIDPQRAD